MRKMELYRFFLLALITQSATFSAFASTVAVGTCRPFLRSYPSISQAVSSVPAGSTVLVCPGIYREQVIITQPLTLTGVQSDNAANPVIAVPAGGLTKNIIPPAPFNLFEIFFQILIQDTEAGLVTISNIAVDGSNNKVPGGSTGTALAGIYYQNSSGIISKIAVYNHFANGASCALCGISTTASTTSITVANSSIHGFDGQGIDITATTPPSLTANIKSNSIMPSNFLSGGPTFAAKTGINVNEGVVANISGNLLITHPQTPPLVTGIGISVRSPNSVVSNNRLESWGIWVLGNSMTIESNKVSLTPLGILIVGRDNVVQSNSIMDTIQGGNAISFNCAGTSNTVTHNLINESELGIAEDPGGNVISPNSFSNVRFIIAGPCP